MRLAKRVTVSGAFLRLERHVGRIHRFAAEVPLQQIDPGFTQDVDRLLVLHPLGHGLHTQAFREIAKRLDEYEVLRVVGEIPDEGAVDLDHVDSQQFQVTERREPRAEIVDGHFAAEFLERVDKRNRLIDV